MILPTDVRQAANKYASENCNGNEALRYLLIEAFVEGYSFSSTNKSDNDDLFEKLWNVYDRKDNKQSAIKAWKKLTPKERTLAAEHIPAFVLARPDKNWRPMFATYCNQKRFLDEEIINQNGTKQPTDNTEREQRFSAYATAIRNIGSEN